MGIVLFLDNCPMDLFLSIVLSLFLYLEYFSCYYIKDLKVVCTFLGLSGITANFSPRPPVRGTLKVLQRAEGTWPGQPIF